jgi:hypothetical protein
MQLDSWYEDLEVVAERWIVLIVRDAPLQGVHRGLRLDAGASLAGPYLVTRQVKGPSPFNQTP